MIARGQWSQFSFLHVYHHFSIFLTYWLVTNAGSNGDVYYTIVANSFIHAVMYTYYGLTTFNIRPWWGFLLTKLQLVQFVTMISQAGYILTMNCAYPHRVTVFYLVYIISLFLLFQSFDQARWGGKDKKVEGKKADGKKLA
jgi:elongation of very long chain fatty acids protein 4